MKKIIVLLIMTLFVNNCARLDKNLLQPDGDALSYKLLPLEVGLASWIQKSDYLESITYQDYITTVFKREVQKNICMENKERETYGYIDLTLIYDETEPEYAYQIIMFPFYIGYSMFGVPYYLGTKEIELELTIYDVNKKQIKTYVESFDKQIFRNIYNYNIADKIAIIEISKIIIERFKVSIQPDQTFLNKELKKTFEAE